AEDGGDVGGGGDGELEIGGIEIGPGAAVTVAEAVLLAAHRAGDPAGQQLCAQAGGGELGVDRARPGINGGAGGGLVGLPAQLDGVGGPGGHRQHRLHRGGVGGEGAGEAAALLPGLHGAVDVDPQVLVVAGIRPPQVGVAAENRLGIEAGGDGQAEVGRVHV